MGDERVDGMSLSMEVRQNVATVSLRGELDILTVGFLEVALAGLVTGGVTEFVIDLAELTFMDSTGLGCFVKLRRDHPEANVKVMNPARQVRSLFDMTGMGPFLSVAS